LQPFSDINKTLKKQIDMQIDIVTNKEIARRLKISESKACRLVRLYREAHSLPKYSPVEWVKFCDFLGLEVKPS
jgi:hypothetical protein